MRHLADSHEEHSNVTLSLLRMQLCMWFMYNATVFVGLVLPLVLHLTVAQQHSAPGNMHKAVFVVFWSCASVWCKTQGKTKRV